MSCELCSQEISVYSVGSCDHPICHMCSFKIRVVQYRNECPLCQNKMPVVSVLAVTYVTIFMGGAIWSIWSYAWGRRYAMGYYLSFKPLLRGSCNKNSSKKEKVKTEHLKSLFLVETELKQWSRWWRHSYWEIEHFGGDGGTLQKSVRSGCQEQYIKSPPLLYKIFCTSF